MISMKDNEKLFFNVIDDTMYKKKGYRLWKLILKI